MKKENRKAAQQRRAQERKKLERQKKIRKIIGWIVGIVIVVLLLLLVVFGDSLFSGSSSSSSSSTDSTSSSSVNTESGAAEDSTSDSSAAEDASSDSTAYSTDASLTVEDGDTVNIDYVGSIDGVEFEGGSTNGAGTDLTIGSGRYIDDFEEQLIGAHPGDTVNVNVTFPDNYQQEDLQGQDALFVVTINGIYNK